MKYHEMIFIGKYSVRDHGVDLTLWRAFCNKRNRKCGEGCVCKDPLNQAQDRAVAYNAHFNHQTFFHHQTNTKRGNVISSLFYLSWHLKCQTKATYSEAFIYQSVHSCTSYQLSHILPLISPANFNVITAISNYYNIMGCLIFLPSLCVSLCVLVKSDGLNVWYWPRTVNKW